MLDSTGQVGLAKVVEASEVVQKLWPFSRQEDLRVYAIFSGHFDLIRNMSADNNALTVFTAYTNEEAVRIHKEMIMHNSGLTNTDNWRWGASMMSVPFQQLVPMDKVSEMMETIKLKHLEIPSKPTQTAKAVEDLEAYTRYVFDQAGASDIEKRALERVLVRFRTKTIQA